MTPCDHKSCPVKNSRWVIYTHDDAPYGQRWHAARVLGGWWCKRHATEKAACFNHEERVKKKNVSLETFVELIGDRTT